MPNSNKMSLVLRRVLPAALFALVLLLAGCNRSTSDSKDHAEDSGQRALDFPTNVIAYQVKGVLREIRADGGKALIAHENIPGYMEAMTMRLDVRNTNELANLQPGDQITFRMLVTDTDGWIDRVNKLGTTARPEIARTTDAVLAIQELEPGALLPDCVLTNQLGQAIHLSDFKGRALAFTFIFTRCPFPTYCPRMNNNLGFAQSRLLQDTTRTNWHLLSISFDPEFDTPERLAVYANGYGQKPEHWSFATGATSDVRKLGGAFGLSFWREGALFNHNVRTVVVDAAGRIQTVFVGNAWQPDDLVKAMKTAMEAKP